MPQQRHYNPVLMYAKVDRIREGLGEDAAELLVNFAVRYVPDIEIGNRILHTIGGGFLTFLLCFTDVSRSLL